MREWVGWELGGDSAYECSNDLYDALRKARESREDEDDKKKPRARQPTVQDLNAFLLFCYIFARTSLTIAEGIVYPWLIKKKQYDFGASK